MNSTGPRVAGDRSAFRSVGRYQRARGRTGFEVRSAIRSARHKTMSVMANGNAVELNAEPMRGHHLRALRITQARAMDALRRRPSVMPHSQAGQRIRGKAVCWPLWTLSSACAPTHRLVLIRYFNSPGPAAPRCDPH